MVSKCLKNNFPILQAISKIKNLKTRQKLLKVLADDKLFFQSLREIATNCLEGNIPLDEKTKTALQKHKKIIRNLATHTNGTKRRKIVSQTGGFLPFLVPAAASVLGHLVKDVIF